MKNFVLLLLALCAISAATLYSQAAPPAMSAAATAASAVLHETETYAIGGVGFGGATSPGETAFRELQRDPDSTAAFLALLDDETTAKAGQLYALLGLKIAKSAQFEARLPAFLVDESALYQFSGCILLPVKVKDIAARFVDKNEAARA